MPNARKSFALLMLRMEIQVTMLNRSADTRCNPGKRELIQAAGKQEAQNPKGYMEKRSISVVSRNKIFNNQEKLTGR